MIVIIHLCAILCFVSVSRATITVDNVKRSELNVLHDIYTSANGLNWTWNKVGEVWDFEVEDPNPCHPIWQGVLCRCEDGTCTILQLELGSFSMIGSLPNSFNNLTNLYNIDFSSNSLNGTIPDSIGMLSNLTILNLGLNKLSGSIPPVFINSTLTMRKMSIYSNYLTGSIPHGLLNNTNSVLQSILAFDNLLSGLFPEINGAIQVINFESNHISGSIIDTICNCSMMESFKINDNIMTGTLPACFGAFPLLSDLHFASNSISGTLPSMLVSSPIPGEFECNNNLLTGPIQDNLCNFQLEALDLASNFLTGTVPDCVAERHFMNYFSVSYNILSGTIPSLVSNLTFLKTLTVNDNIMTGTLPDISLLGSLEFLYVQNNQLHGPLDLHFNVSRLLLGLSFLDVSNNQFTGTLPTQLFSQSLALLSFAAGSNCLTGNIPEELCNMNLLVFLDLDGMSTADNCRVPIFSGLDFIKSFTLKNEITGGIPSCLFNMSSLNTLHISGNSIDWSFPDNLKISRELKELSLSHNRLTGTIPHHIQTKQWDVLDLSYNKLTGMIMSNWSFTDGSPSLVLQVNRLSGGIPSSLVNLPSINILTGNLFGCNFQRSSLPIHDTAYDIYQCGSNTFYQASVVWGVCIFTICIVALAIGWRSSVLSWFSKVAEQFREFMSVFENVDGNDGLYIFKQQLLSFRNAIVTITILLLVVVVAVYVSLTEYYKTADHQYAWTVSAGYISGETPAIALLILYSLLIVFLFIIWVWLKHSYSSSYSEITSHSHLSWTQFSILSVLVLINCVIMSCVNFGYVEIILNYNAAIIFVTQVSMALFKLLWNDFSVRGLVYIARRFYSNQDSNESLTKSLVKGDIEHENSKFIAKEMPFITFIILFNCIIAPCLATAAVDRNCFLNAFVPDKSVSTDFPVYNCVISQVEIRECNSEDASLSYIGITYDPPYIYSYQCASSILVNYAAVFVFMFLMVAFFKLIVLALMVSLQPQVKEDSYMHYAMDNTIYKLLKPASLQTLQDGDVLFYKDRFVLRMISKVSVLLTFGVVFPPLAAIVCVAFFTETYLNLIMIGRFLCSINDIELRLKFRDLIVSNVKGCQELLLRPVVWLIVPFAAVFYGFFIFDTYGDEVGSNQAYWVLIVMSVVPLFIGLVYQLIHLMTSKTSNKDDLIRMSEQRDKIVVNTLFSDTVM